MTKVQTIGRVKLGQDHSERVLDLKSFHDCSGMFTVAPDGSPVFTRDISSDEIYSLELELR